MQNSSTPSFLQAFIGSFINFKAYAEYVKRSGASMFGHFLLLVTLCCSLYALASTMWLNENVNPYLDDLTANVPAITVKDGKAVVDIEQPHFFKIENEVVAVIDTTQDPQVHLDQHPALIVLSEQNITIKESSGKVEIYELSTDFTLDSVKVGEWVGILKSWYLPTLFSLCFLWQVFWKAFQVLVVAAVVTLVQKSRPGLSQNLKLATLALGPAMSFGVLVYFVTIFAAPIPGSGAVFWAILGGLTYYGSEKLKSSPIHS